jgi:hypothetical protein
MSEAVLRLVKPLRQRALRAYRDHLSGGDEKDHDHAA